MEHQNLFLMPVWRALGKTRIVFQARVLPKTISITAAVLLLILILCLWPAELTMESKGALEPVQRQDVFAQIDGKVEELKVAHLDRVTKGQLLLRLGSNSDFDVQLEQIEGEFQATSKRLNAVNTGLASQRLTAEERIRLAGDQAELQQKLQSAQRRTRHLAREESGIERRSPIDGVVVTWDLWNRLINRPVQRGQALLRVANTEGPWELELHMPENRMGHVVEVQQKLYDQSREKLRELLREQLLRQDARRQRRATRPGSGKGPRRRGRRTAPRQDSGNLPRAVPRPVVADCRPANGRETPSAARPGVARGHLR